MTLRAVVHTASNRPGVLGAGRDAGGLDVPFDFGRERARRGLRVDESASHGGASKTSNELFHGAPGHI